MALVAPSVLGDEQMIVVASEARMWQCLQRLRAMKSECYGEGFVWNRVRS